MNDRPEHSLLRRARILERDALKTADAAAIDEAAEACRTIRAYACDTETSAEIRAIADHLDRAAAGLRVQDACRAVPAGWTGQA